MLYLTLYVLLPACIGLCCRERDASDEWTRWYWEDFNARRHA